MSSSHNNAVVAPTSSLQAPTQSSIDGVGSNPQVQLPNLQTQQQQQQGSTSNERVEENKVSSIDSYLVALMLKTQEE